MRKRELHQYPVGRSVNMIPCNRPHFGSSEFLAMMRPEAGRKDFEIQFANSVGASFGIAFPFGRDGIFATLKALELRDVEVILPAYTCEVVPRAVVASGNRPHFADISLADYNMDMDALKLTLTDQPSVIIATHLYGYPIEIDNIRHHFGNHRIIIEDCAQRLVSPDSGPVGIKGDVAIFSFSRGKPICTVEGGMVITNSPELYEKIKAVRDKAFNRGNTKIWVKRWSWMLASYIVYQKQIFGMLHRARNNIRKIVQSRSESNTFLLREPSWAYMNFQGRVGMAQLQKLDTMIIKRRSIANLYDQELKEITGIFTAPRTNGCSYSSYTIRVPKRDVVHFKDCMAFFGVSVGQDYSYVLPQLKPYQPFAKGDYPSAKKAAEEVVNLPCYPGLKEIDVRYVAACVRACIRNQ